MEHEWKIVKSFPVTFKEAAVYLLNTFLVAKSTLQIPSNLTPNCSLLSQQHFIAPSAVLIQQFAEP